MDVYLPLVYIADESIYIMSELWNWMEKNCEIKV